MSWVGAGQELVWRRVELESCRVGAWIERSKSTARQKLGRSRMGEEPAQGGSRKVGSWSRSHTKFHLNCTKTEVEKIRYWSALIG